MKRIKTYKKCLAFYEIAGGILGIALTIGILIGESFSSAGPYILIGLAICLYSFSIFSGIRILKYRNLKFSRINQILQIFSFCVKGYGFQYIAGFFITIGYNLVNYNILLKAGLSTWQFSFSFDDGINKFQVNIIAVLLLIAIEYLMKKEIEDQNYTIQIPD